MMLDIFIGTFCPLNFYSFIIEIKYFIKTIETQGKLAIFEKHSNDNVTMQINIQGLVQWYKIKDPKYLQNTLCLV